MTTQYEFAIWALTLLILLGFGSIIHELVRRGRALDEALRTKPWNDGRYEEEEL